jgi:hypothetical protein
VIHLQDAEARSLYDLDRLWGDALRVDWQADTAAASPTSSPDDSDLDPA